MDYWYNRFRLEEEWNKYFPKKDFVIRVSNSSDPMPIIE